MERIKYRSKLKCCGWGGERREDGGSSDAGGGRERVAAEIRYAHSEIGMERGVLCVDERRKRVCVPRAFAGAGRTASDRGPEERGERGEERGKEGGWKALPRHMKDEYTAPLSYSSSPPAPSCHQRHEGGVGGETSDTQRGGEGERRGLCTGKEQKKN